MVKKIVNVETKYHCRECKHSYDWYGEDWNGDALMCYCKISKWCKLLSQKQCENFELKK